jgi:hypothetical protein
VRCPHKQQLPHEYPAPGSVSSSQAKYHPRDGGSSSECSGSNGVGFISGILFNASVVFIDGVTVPGNLVSSPLTGGLTFLF